MVQTPVGVCRFDGKSFDWITEEDVTEFRDEGANGVRSILEDKNGDFWFNTEYRYSVYDSVTLKINTFYTRRESIGGLDGKKESGLDEYLSSAIDNNHNLWFVTYLDGVWKYDGMKITHFTRFRIILKTFHYSAFTRTTAVICGLGHMKMGLCTNLMAKHLKNSNCDQWIK
ncbi:MAG: two-component regulator propeller domain-containing protein [Bacteroidales bacterium]